jgi:hypothetical protein
MLEVDCDLMRYAYIIIILALVGHAAEYIWHVSFWLVMPLVGVCILVIEYFHNKKIGH